MAFRPPLYLMIPKYLQTKWQTGIDLCPSINESCFGAQLALDVLEHKCNFSPRHSASTWAKGFYPDVDFYPTRPLWAGGHVQSVQPVSVPVALHLLVVPPASALRQAAQGHLPAVAEAQQEEGGVLGRHVVWHQIPGLIASHHFRLLAGQAGPGWRDCG